MFCSGMVLRTWLGIIYAQVLHFQAFSAVFHHLPSKVPLLERKQFLTCGSLQTWRLLSHSKMCNPRWEQRAPTCKPAFAFSKTQFRPDQTYNYPRPSILSVSRLYFNIHDSCLSSQVALASDTKGNSCLGCCFWKKLFRKNMETKPGTSEIKARNSTRKVGNQYSLSLRPNGRHVTHSQMGCIGTRHLRSDSPLYEGGQAVK